MVKIVDTVWVNSVIRGLGLEYPFSIDLVSHGGLDAPSFMPAGSTKFTDGEDQFAFSTMISRNKETH